VQVNLHRGAAKAPLCNSCELPSRIKRSLLRLPVQENPHSSWVGTRRVALRYVSSSPPFSTVHATFTAHGAAPLVVLHGYP
jgi:hypothetical protein